jgi:plastocyanin
MHLTTLVVAACMTMAFGGPLPARAGTLAGTVRVAGPPPARPPLPVYKHAEVCGPGVVDDRLVVGPAGGLRYAVVTVEGVEGGRTPDRDLVHVLDNVGCRFDPHVQVAEVGQRLELRNSDPILHNAHAQIGDRPLYNVALPPARRLVKPLDTAGTIAFNCDVRHTWMSAFVVVAEHPYHTVTDAYGAYEIGDLPAGAYTVRVWHEELGTQQHRVTVGEHGTAVLDVAYPAPRPAGKAG